MSDPRVVVITGGSKGIGRATALRFSKEGARIILVHYDSDDIESDKTLSLLESNNVEAESLKADVSSFGSVDALIKDIHSRFERIDVLVNNAGITKDSLLVRMKEGDWDSVISVNLKSAFNCTQAVAKIMMKQREGAICNVTSVVGQIGNVGQSNYAASKAGIMGFTKSVARELAPRGINVNAVAPGFVDTDMTAILHENVKEAFLQQIPFKRIGRPEDIAEAVYWLCSPQASYITGQIVHVNGGMYM
jgi:3-oxoacyl-[acyl-carrier protein] reductase